MKLLGCSLLPAAPAAPCPATLLQLGHRSCNMSDGAGCISTSSTWADVQPLACSTLRPFTDCAEQCQQQQQQCSSSTAVSAMFAMPAAHKGALSRTIPQPLGYCVSGSRPAHLPGLHDACFTLALVQNQLLPCSVPSLEPPGSVMLHAMCLTGLCNTLFHVLKMPPASAAPATHRCCRCRCRDRSADNACVH